jgi:hypothetical protein
MYPGCARTIYSAAVDGYPMCSKSESNYDGQGILKVMKTQFPNEENNSRTALAGLTTNKFQIVFNSFVVNAARHVLLFSLAKI